MAEPSSTTVKQLGIVATREQHCKQDNDIPTFVQLHPFGVTCYVVLQKGDRFSAVSDTAEKVLYHPDPQFYSLNFGEFTVFFEARDGKKKYGTPSHALE